MISELKLPKEILNSFGFTITRILQRIIEHNKLEDLSDLFPLGNNWDLIADVRDNWIVARISHRSGTGIPTVGKLKENDLAFIQGKISACENKSCQEIFDLLGIDWISFNKFTYVGPWGDLGRIGEQLVEWLNHFVLSEVYRKNEARVMRAIPMPPSYDIRIFNAIFVLECEEEIIQGTAFYLKDVGFITCQHVLGSNTKAYHPKDRSKKFPITILSQNETIDLALIEIENIDVVGLPSGSNDTVKIMEHIAIAGYPNYNFGDTGTFTPGLIIGFRTVSAIRRMLTNAPIIAGCSGGPVINSSNEVIGIAVTGSKSMSTAHETENHGIIPIDALQHLL